MVHIAPVLRKRSFAFDGSCPVSIRITNNRTSAYLSTNVIAPQADIVGNAIRPWSITAENIASPLKEVRDIVSLLPEADTSRMTASEIVSHIKGKIEERKGFKLDFISYMRRIGEKKGGASGNNYSAAANALCRAINAESLDISNITVRLLRSFEDFLRTEKDKKGVIHNLRKPSLYLSCVRRAHNLARVEFNDPDLGIMRIPSSPFDYYKVPPPPPSRHKNKDVATIQLMIDSRSGLTGRKRFGVDLFLISFALMGMNVPDLYYAKDAKNGIITYNRIKTMNLRKDRAEMRVKMDPCVAKLFNEYKGSDGYVFDLRDRYANYVNAGQNANRGLKAWCEDMGLQYFKVYSARHSWGTIATSALCKIDKYTVNDCLCHVAPGMDVTDIYVEKDWSLFWEANSKVLALFDWSKL